MHRSLSKRKRVTATFIVMLLVTTLVASFTPRTTATSAQVLTAPLTATATPTINIDPINGTVGTEVKVNGTIDTLNGSYTVRWNGTINVTTGYALGYDVATSFVIPQTVGAPLPGREVFVELIDNNTTETANNTFRLFTEYHIKAVVPSPPSQLQEGNTTDIWVNVTGGEANAVYFANITVKEPPPANSTYWTTVSLTNTTTTGYGEGSITYPANFSAGANTNYVGTHNIAFNETLATGNFTVGLTDKLEYRRIATVHIQGAGYGANETVTINITTAGASVEDYPKNLTADANGVVTDSWEIPHDAKPGNYTVTLINATTLGTDKKPADMQNFTVVGAVCLIQAWNRAVPPEPLANVTVIARNVTIPDVILGLEKTNETGWAEFPVNFGDYSFEVEWKVDGNDVIVGLLNQSFTEIRTYKLNLTCWIAHMKIAIQDEAGDPLPLIDVTLNYTYTTDNDTVSPRETFETNTTGIVTLRNTLVNVSYTIEARRYGYLFNTTQIENLTATGWINITCPTYTLFVHVLDSKGIPLQNVEVAVYEWSSELLAGSGATNEWGSIDPPFRCTFGRYKIRVYDWESRVVLNETVIDLIEDRFFFVIHCRIFNVDLSVLVKDYFGNPISNALVKVERENVDIAPKKTGSNGKTSFENITGGEVRVSVSVKGKLSETRTIYLDETRAVVFRLDRYVVVAGYPLETTQFIACISLGMLVALFALALIYRRFRTRKVSEGKEKSL